MIGLDAASQQTLLTGITAVGAVASIYYGGRALRAKATADRGVRELDMVKVSQASLESALAQNTADNVSLRAENVRLRVELDDIREDCAAKLAECRAQIRDLTNRLMETQRQVAEAARKANGT